MALRVDHPEVMREQHWHLNRGQHSRVIAASADRSRPERASPLGIVLLHVLRRLLARGCRLEERPEVLRQLVFTSGPNAFPIAHAPLVAEILAPQRKHPAYGLVDRLTNRRRCLR